MGKGEIACYKQFLLFPQCFQEACFPGASKGVIVWEWVNKKSQKNDYYIYMKVLLIYLHSLTLSKTSPGFTCLQYKSFENTVGKGEIACNEKFLLFLQCFLSVWITFCHFQQVQNCHLQTLSVYKLLKFVVWESVKID